MTAEAKPWFPKVWAGKAGRLGRSDWATQAAVLLPVVAIAALTAWMMLSAPMRASVASRDITSSNAATPTEAASASAEEATAPAGPSVASGLKISSQSWRRGGLGSNALVTLTLRNDNDFAVKDIEIGCTFSRSDGSHLTDRRRVIPDAVVDRKSRKTFARLHVGYVNINANKAKCAPVAANRI